MKSFFLSAVKHKNLFALIVLFFVLSGFVLPNIALAFSIDPNTFRCQDGVFASISIECFNYYTAYTISSLGDLFTWIGGTFLEVSSQIFLFASDNLIKDSAGNWTITRDSGYAGTAFIDSWNVVKNWANMLIVLGFIAVAMSFILSLEQYKKLLAPLLIVALLVNFSILFVGLMIDASNIVMTNLSGSGQGVSDIQYKINAVWNHSLYKYPIDSFTSSLIYVSLSVMFTNIYVITGLTLFLFAMIFVVRYVALALLFILSPLAFVFRVIPIESAKKMWGSWWQHFLKWCFIGVSGAFFLNLATKILAALNNRLGPITANSPGSLVISSAIAEMFFYLSIVIIFLLAGLWLTFKSNALVTVVLSAVAAIVGAILTGGASLAGGVLSIAGRATPARGGLTNTKNAVKDTFSNLYHGARQVFGGGTGTLATARQNRMQERLKEPTERLKNVNNATLARTAVSGRTPAERAAATNILRERDSLNEIPEAHRQRAMANAIAHDNKLRPSDFAKSDYRFAELDNLTLRRIETTNGWTSGDPRARAIARLERLRTNLPSMSSNQRATIDLNDITPELITSRGFNANMIESFQIADRAHIDRLRDPLVGIGAELTARITAAVAAGNRAEANRLRNIEEAINRLP